MPHNGPDGHAQVSTFEAEQKAKKTAYCATLGRLCATTCDNVSCEHNPGHQDVLKEEGAAWDAAG